MFGLTWAQIGIIVLVGAFVLGPERIPTAVTFVTGSLRKLRTMATGAQAGLRSEIGPELDELRRQIADLQSIKELQELRDLHPKNLFSKGLLGPEFSGGAGGSLGMGMPNNSAIEAFAAQTAAVHPSPAGTAAPAMPGAAVEAPSAGPSAVDAETLGDRSHCGVVLTKPARALAHGESAPFDIDGT